MNRRSFAKTLAAGALLATGSCGRLPARPIDVLVLGAGFAGLAAAGKLVSAGRETLVLEARDRVGGRAFTEFELPDRPEYGALEIGDSYARVHALAARHGLAIDPPDRRWLSQVALHVNGQTLAADEWPESAANRLPAAERAIAPFRIESHYLGRANPLAAVEGWDGPGLLGEDRSISRVLEEQGASPEALRLINVAGNHNHSDEVSALGPWKSALARRRETGAGQFSAGAEALAKAMAEDIAPHVRLASVVRAIERTGEGVRVRLGDGTEVRSRHCICTLPLPALRQVRINLPLADAQRNAFTGVPYTRVTVALLDADPFWEEDGLPPFMWTDTPMERFFPRVHPQTGECIGLKAFINGRGTEPLDALDEDEFARLAVATVERIRPAAKGRVRYLGRHRWGVDPFAGGAYAAWSPGQVARQRAALRAAAGPVLFAGEHTALDAPGMEGAIRSGERAAAQLIQPAVADAHRAAGRLARSATPMPA